VLVKACFDIRRTILIELVHCLVIEGIQKFFQGLLRLAKIACLQQPLEAQQTLVQIIRLFDSHFPFPYIQFTLSVFDIFTAADFVKSTKPAL